MLARVMVVKSSGPSKRKMMVGALPNGSGASASKYRPRRSKPK
jgi:hypothetical protein